MFRGAGWNVIKVLWGSRVGRRCSRTTPTALLVKRMGEVVDGEYQRYVVEDGAYLRKHFLGTDPRLLEMVKHLSDDELKKLRVGGHDPVKVYNAYSARSTHKGMPTVILARTIKGYGLGEAGEGKNITHQQKKMNEADLQTFRDSLRHSDPRRRHRGRAVLPSGRRQPGSCSTCRSAARRSAASCRSASCTAPSRSSRRSPASSTSS